MFWPLSLPLKNFTYSVLQPNYPMLMEDIQKLTERALERCGAYRKEALDYLIWMYDFSESGKVVGYFTGKIEIPDREQEIVEGAALLVYVGLEKKLEDAIIAKVTEEFNIYFYGKSDKSID